MEAAGHVQATVSLTANLPAIVKAVSPLPVLASGGIATGRGHAAALVLGAQGVSMGTRFIATHEAFASSEYKHRFVAAQAQDTVYLNLFDGGFPPYAPHRVLRNKAVTEWEMAGRPVPGERPGENTNVGIVEHGGSRWRVARYYSSQATPEFAGDLDYMPLWCGESCTHINDIKPAAEVVHDIISEAEEVIQQARRWLR